MGRLSEEIGGGPVGLDACAFIFYLEENPRFLPLLDPVFTAVAEGRLEGATSALTLLETLVGPYRQSDEILAQRYETLLLTTRGLKLVGLSPKILKAAAHLRAVTRIKTPDAIQIASAVAAGCSSFVTNDRRLPSLPGLKILNLSDYLPTGSSVHEKRARTYGRARAMGRR